MRKYKRNSQKCIEAVKSSLGMLDLPILFSKFLILENAIIEKTHIDDVENEIEENR